MAAPLGNGAIWLLSTLFLIPITTVIYRLFLHPLARVPGPKVAAISRLWQAQQHRNGRLFTIKLHREYGPVVRIAPNEVAFDSADAFHELYRAGSSFQKGEWYQSTKSKRGRVDWLGRRETPPDTLDLLPESNMELYRMQRRAFGPVYSASNMKRYEAVIDGCLARVVSKLRSLDGRQVNLTEWVHIISLGESGSFHLIRLDTYGHEMEMELTCRCLQNASARRHSRRILTGERREPTAARWRHHTLDSGARSPWLDCFLKS